MVLDGVVRGAAHVRGLVGDTDMAAAEAVVGVQRGRGEREREDEGGESVDHDDSRRAKGREEKTREAVNEGRARQTSRGEVVVGRKESRSGAPF